MISKELFKERLRELRKEKGETQVQAASEIGIAGRNYQKFELGESFPSAEALCALADHFEVSLDYLMGRTDQREIRGLW